MSEQRTTDPRLKELHWYRRYGAHGERRIARDNRGLEYVIGDWSWTRTWNRPEEYIEHLMPNWEPPK